MSPEICVAGGAACDPDFDRKWGGGFSCVVIIADFALYPETDYNTVEIWPLKPHQQKVVAMVWEEDILVVRDSEWQQGVAVVEEAVGGVDDLFFACWICSF
jgi:hypothetical protein